jgi:hypothetical protein
MYKEPLLEPISDDKLNYLHFGSSLVQSMNNNILHIEYCTTERITIDKIIVRVCGSAGGNETRTERRIGHDPSGSAKYVGPSDTAHMPRHRCAASHARGTLTPWRRASAWASRPLVPSKRLLEGVVSKLVEGLDPQSLILRPDLKRLEGAEHTVPEGAVRRVVALDKRVVHVVVLGGKYFEGQVALIPSEERWTRGFTRCNGEELRDATRRGCVIK